MGEAHKFRRRPNNRNQFSGWNPKPPRKRRYPKRFWQRQWFPPLALLLLAIGLATAKSFPSLAAGEPFQCAYPRVLDGDTIRCGDSRVRLQGIDAPELPGHCRPGRECTPGDPYASTQNLSRLIGANTLECRQVDIDRYGRVVARCFALGKDLSCGQLEAKQAVRRYGMIWC